MDRRIKLTDVDRPDEPLEVEVERIAETSLRVIVPNTVVKFELRRSSGDTPFEGSLGGRYFVFELDSKPKAKPKPRGKSARE